MRRQRHENRHSPPFAAVGVERHLDFDRSFAQAIGETTVTETDPEIETMESDYSGVLASLKKAELIRPDSSEFPYEMALVYMRTVSAYLWRARLLERESQLKKDIADLEVFVALDAHYPPAYRELAWLYTTVGQRDKASLALCKYEQTKATVKRPDQTPFFLTQPGRTVFRQAHAPSP